MKDRLVQEHGLQITFTGKSGDTFDEGDIVVLVASKTVGLANLGSPFPVGRVIVDASGVVNNDKLTVRTQYGSLVNHTAGETIVAGPVVLGSDGKVYNWTMKTADGAQTITFATNATGDGDHTITIDDVVITISPAASATPTTTASALVTAVNSNHELRSIGIWATNSSGVVTLHATGKIADGIATTAATTDSSQTAVAGGTTLTGGVGYPMEAVYGLAIEDAASAADCAVLTKE